MNTPSSCSGTRYNSDPKPDIEPPEKYRDLPDCISFEGTVTRCDPPRLLAHTWVSDDVSEEVCYELSEQGDKVLLVLTHRRIATRDQLTGAAAGWHTHLGILIDVLNGAEPEPFWKRNTELETEYEARM